MVEYRQPTIQKALGRVREEIELVQTERQAFETFRGRLTKIQANTPTAEATAAAGSTRLVAAEPLQPTQLQEVRDAYRETVMGMSHYNEEYGDTLRESLREELGETLAGYLLDGQLYTPSVQDALQQATRECHENRRRYLGQLREERDSLETIEEELNEAESQVFEIGERLDEPTTSAELACMEETLERLERRCTNLATERQEMIHDRAGREISGFDSVSLSKYLYAELDTETPALSDIVSCLDTIRSRRVDCLR